MLKNARTLAIGGVDTVENETLKVRWRGVSNPRSWVNRRNKHRSGDLTGAARRQIAKELRLVPIFTNVRDEQLQELRRRGQAM